MIKKRSLTNIIGALIFFTQGLFAEPLKVSAIPWVQSNLEIPHVAINNLPTQLQAIAEFGTCSGTYAYRWDINGDGDYNDQNENWLNSSSVSYAGYFAPLSLDVQYSSAIGDRLYFPKVQVQCGSETQTAIMPVLVKVSRLCPNYANDPQNPSCSADDSFEITQQTHSARAIDRGLWYLFRQAIHRSNDSLGNNAHLCYISGTQTLYSTGQALNTFLRRGHGFGIQRDTDPYYRHMTQCGLHSLLSTMQLRVLSFDDTASLGTDSQGMQFSALNGLSAFFWSSYESTSWVEPLANFGNPNYISPVGRIGVLGQSLQNIGQDLADGLIQCMTADGAWFYTCSNLAGVTDDASTNGWAPEALRLLNRKLGVETYDSYKQKQKTWLATHCPSGSCTYDGGGGKLSGNALVGYGWVENEISTTNIEIADAIDWIDFWFQNDPNHYGLYYLYAATKGLRSFVPEITKLPSGIDWHKEFSSFFLGGKNAKYNNSTAKQNTNGSWSWAGNWLWATSLSTNERTSLVIQILQSWLETFAYARAYPQQISPNTEVTFDHSWSYTLDPSVTIIEYKWNVIDYLDPNRPICELGEIPCVDKNGDGDCEDALEQCNEDLNGNSVLDDSEIGWEFSSSQKNFPFKFTYTTPVGWGEIKRNSVILRVVDNFGRYVDDRSSIEIKVSKLNHPPTIVAHPDGMNVSYKGYAGSLVKLDGRMSYDADTNELVFPGSTERPMGLIDHITSIHFDTNLDGDFDDVGENGTDRLVDFVIGQNTLPNDLLAVPIRVCDDGQWTDSCIDGLDQADCSICSYGSATIRVLENLLPPILVTKAPYGVLVNPQDQTELIPKTLDLSESYDPDGVLGLKCQYEIVEGLGSFIESGEFLADTNDMGSNVTYKPFGDGPRVDRIKVIGTDFGGLSSEAIFEINVPNTQPGILDVGIRFDTTNPPLIDSYHLESLGDGWYRLSVNAYPYPFANGFVSASATDKSDSTQILFDMDGDGLVDFESSYGEIEQLRESNSFEYLSESMGIVQVAARDIDGAESQKQGLEYHAPKVAEYLKYTLNLLNDATIESYASPQSTYTFFANPTNEPLLIAVAVEDNLGNITLDQYFADVSNENPILESLEIIPIGNMGILVLVSGIDVDGDSLHYEIAMGDGSEIKANTRGFFVHDYQIPSNELPKTLELQIKLVDGRGGESVHIKEIRVQGNTAVEPIVNNPPTITDIRINIGNQGLVEIECQLNDLDGDALNLWVSFGDENVDLPTEKVIYSNRFEHSYEYRTNPYELTVRAFDGKEYSILSTRNIEIIDHPTQISNLSYANVGNGHLILNADAQDLDTANLEYSWDFDGDSSYEIQNASTPITIYQYPTPNEHTAILRVRDTWSKVDEYRSLKILAENPPQFQEISMGVDTRGFVSFRMLGQDLDGDVVSYWVNFDVDRDLNAWIPIPSGVITHDYLYQTNPYLVGFKVVDSRGLATEETRDLFIVDTPTEIRELMVFKNGGRVELRIFAFDVDSYQDLLYSIDFNNDGIFEIENSYASIGLYEYLESGNYSAKVRVIDTWSGNAVEQSLGIEIVLPRLDMSIVDQGIVDQGGVDQGVVDQGVVDQGVVDQGTYQPIVRDHIQGEEGRCIIFRTGSLHIGLDIGTKVDANTCTSEDPAVVGMEWSWDFGDSSALGFGLEVGHRYVDDGVYSVLATNSVMASESYGIQVNIANVAPIFLSNPPLFVARNGIYSYDVFLEDVGIEDEIILNVDTTIGGLDLDQITLTRQDEQGKHWLLKINTLNVLQDSISLTLVAQDGHNKQGNRFVFDGGRTEQRLIVYFVESEQEMEFLDMGLLDSNVVHMKDVQVLDQTIDALASQFSGGDRSNGGCKQISNLSDSLIWILLFWFIGLLIRVLKTKKLH